MHSLIHQLQDLVYQIDHNCGIPKPGGNSLIDQMHCLVTQVAEGREGPCQSKAVIGHSPHSSGPSSCQAAPPPPHGCPPPSCGCPPPPYACSPPQPQYVTPICYYSPWPPQQ